VSQEKQNNPTATRRAVVLNQTKSNLKLEAKQNKAKQANRI